MSSSTSDSPSLLHGRVLAFAAILLAAVNLRTAVTSITPLLDVLGQQFGFGTTMTGVLGMLPTASFALFGVATPALARRLGLERTTLLAMVMAMAGLLLRSSAGNVGTLLLGSVLALAGMGIGNVVVPPLVKRYFANKVGTMSTLYISVLQLGTMLPALFAVPMANAAGWRVSLGMWALLALAAALPWLVLARRAPKPQADATDPAAQPHGKVWRTSLGWSMTLMFGMTSLMTYSMFTWLPRIVVEAGGTPAFGGVMVAVFSALGLLPSLVIPSMAVRMQNPFPLVLIGFFSFVIAFTGLLLAPMTAPPAMGVPARRRSIHLPAGADPDQPAHAHPHRLGGTVRLHAGRGLQLQLSGAVPGRLAAYGQQRLDAPVQLPVRLRHPDAVRLLGGLQAAQAGRPLVSRAGPRNRPYLPLVSPSAHFDTGLTIPGG